MAEGAVVEPAEIQHDGPRMPRITLGMEGERQTRMVRTVRQTGEKRSGRQILQRVERPEHGLLPVESARDAARLAVIRIRMGKRDVEVETGTIHNEFHR